MKKTSNTDPKLLQALVGGTSSHFTKSKGSLYEFYLSGEILDPESYIDWFDVIRNAGPQDTVKMFINSPGGDLYTAIQFLRVFSETEAEIIASVEGACMSAATIIFLHADQHEVTNHSAFMFHDYSSGVFGKGGEQYDQIQFERKWSEAFLKDAYAGFLTDNEINSMLHNKDIWMTSQEVVARLKVVESSSDEDEK